ncbi:MAG: hypothetical protein ABFC80_03640 [Coriobacteriales bacterium]
MITVDDLKDKAMRIKDMAQAEVREVRRSGGMKLAVAGALMVTATVCVAYYLGTRRCR